ncbi:hypothetical protein IJG12_00050 [Candidatus Saccharibacteria bacterium]|nr:hypothetical protein [Candidatus Saccharibacteria bacterium]
MLKKLSLIKWLILAGLLVVVIVLVLQRDRVYDYYRGITYKPSAEMVKIRDSLDLTSEGEFIFNASQPALSERDEFNQNCRPTDAETAILGCYVMENIYVYNIEDEQLKGIKELTAAHELLHAVYARMSDEKKNNLESVLRQVYKDNKEILEDDLKIYSSSERSEELYVRAGTEVKTLPDVLEKHYAKYFTNQDKVVSYYDSYIAVFRRLKAELKALEAEMSELNTKIDNMTTEYKNRVVQYEADVDQFNTCADTPGCFTSQWEFDTRRNVLVNEQIALDALYDEISNLIAEYNKKVEVYNSDVIETNRLTDKMNSNVKPKEDIK